MSSVITLFIPDPHLHEAVAASLIAAQLTWRNGDKNHDFVDSDILLIDQAALTPALTARLAEKTEKPTVLLLGEAGEGDALTESFAKPFRLGHLLNRIRYYRDTAPLLRDHAVVFGGFRLEPRQRNLIHPTFAEPIRLTEKETALLMFLAASTEPVTRQDILAAVWGYDERIDTHTLETHLYQLRRKLDETKTEWLISTNGTYALNRGAA